MRTRAEPGPSPDWIGAREACALLGVKRETLYAYVSRGHVRTAASPKKTGAPRTRLYHREDLERLLVRSQARAGHGPVAAAALRWGEPVLETRIGTIGAEGPIYRGRSAIELASRGEPFESVCELLWQGPFEVSCAADVVDVAAARALLGQSSEPFDAMLVASAALALRAGAVEPESPGGLVRQLIAAAAVARGSDVVASSLSASDCASGLLVALGVEGRHSVRHASFARTAINEALVLSADHELNVSTFACRVAASTGATLAASMVAALAALSGPLHGRATARLVEAISEIGRPERADAFVEARLERGEAIAGFGHPLYPGGDPRGARLVALAERSPRASRPLRVLFALADAIERRTGARATLDAGLVAVASAVGLSAGAPLAIFACGRSAGWMAHALEQRAAGYLLRPRARYVGGEPP